MSANHKEGEVPNLYFSLKHPASISNRKLEIRIKRYSI